MLDGKAWPALQRSAGMARLEMGAGPHGAQLRKLRQEGCAKVFLPKGAPGEAVFLNTSGGLTGGDRVSFNLALAQGLDFAATTQTAERAYASAGGAAEMRVNLSVGAGSQLAWLPQETILYQDSHLNRVTDISLAQGATLLTCEMVILGRHAMREEPTNLVLQDLRRIHIAGRLFWSESVRLCQDTIQRKQGAALLGRARCFATLVMVGPGVEGAASALSPYLCAANCETALSAWDGRLILRVTAHHSWPLRCQIARILSQLRGKPLPRVWQMNGDIE